MSWRAEFLFLLLVCAGPAEGDEFMPANLPARSVALGGSSVADPQGAAAAQENLAGLSFDGNDLWLRYQSIALDVPAPDLGQGAMEMRWNALPGLGFGLLWQHLFSGGLSRDRLRVGMGLDLGRWAGLKGLRLGVGLDRLQQQYTLDPAFTYAGLQSTRSEAYDAAAGLLWSPKPWFSLGLAADQLTSPNLGLVGPDVFSTVFSWDGGFHVPLRSVGALYLHFGQAWNSEGLTPQAGLEWSSPGGGLALRAGSDGTTFSVGTGFKVGSLRLDYVYRMGLNAQAAAFGGSQGVDLGLDFGEPAVARSVQGVPALVIPRPDPVPTPAPTALPDPALAEVSQAITLWGEGSRHLALELISRALRDRQDMPTVTALKSAWERALTPLASAPPPPAVAAGLAEAEAFRAQGRDDLARETLKKVLAADPLQGQAKAALKALDRPKVTLSAKTKSRKLFEKGMRLYGSGHQDEALAAWEKALKLDPGNMEALNSLTRARIQGEQTR